VRYLLSEPGVAVVAVVIAARPAVGPTGLRHLLYRLRRRLFMSSSESRPIDLASLVEESRIVPDGNPLEDLALDVIVSLVAVPARDAGARPVRRGVWVFQHDLDEGRDGRPPGFWEVHDASPLTHAVLLELPSSGGSPAVLREGAWNTDRRSYRRNRDRLRRTVADWPALACREVLGGLGRAPVTPPARAGGDIRGLPRNHHLLPLTWGALRYRVRLAWQRFFRHAQWNIGVIPSPIASCLSNRSPAVRWFAPDRTRFLADPFGIVREGTITVVCEEYRYRAGRGRIAYAPLHEGRIRGLVAPAIEAPFHLSYPCLVEDAGVVYCIPETARHHEIALYRAERFPDRWTREAVLVPGFAGADPTVFRHDGLWWLTSTDADRDADSHLCVWYASALRGRWTPHPRNPVKIDARSSRPGGTPFVHEGVLYRPTQDCAGRYGRRVVLNHVEWLTPTEFHEYEVGSIGPLAGGPFPDGVHTLSAVGDLTLIDGLRHVFSPVAMWRFAGYWVRTFLTVPTSRP
jgi:hypothetical protein